MSTYSSRLRWFVIQPFSSKSLSRIAEQMLAAKYDERLGFGYVLSDVRKSHVSGRFVQRETVTSSFLDPSGNEKTLSFEQFCSTTFILRTAAPHLEIANPARRVSELLTSIGDMLDNTISIVPIEVRISDWLAAFKKANCSVTALKLVTDNVTLSPSISVKATFSGNNDVRSEASKFFKTSRVLPELIAGTLAHEHESATFKLSVRGVFTFLSEPSESVREAVRKAATLIAAQK